MSWSPLSKPGMVSLTWLAEGKGIATHKHPLPAGDAVVTRKTTGGFRAYQRRSQNGDLSSISVRHAADHRATTACEGEARRHVCPSLERNTAPRRRLLFWFAQGKASCHGILQAVWAPRAQEQEDSRGMKRKTEAEG